MWNPWDFFFPQTGLVYYMWVTLLTKLIVTYKIMTFPPFFSLFFLSVLQRLFSLSRMSPTFTYLCKSYTFDLYVYLEESTQICLFQT